MIGTPQAKSWNEQAVASPSDNSSAISGGNGVNNDSKYLEAEALLTFYQNLTENYLSKENTDSLNRDSIIRWFTILTFMQLFFINIIIIVALTSMRDYMDIIFDFLKYFVGATFIELLGGLLIIVNWLFNHNVFKLINSISDILSNKSKS